MKIIKNSDLPLAGDCVIITGNFDGVHVGHRKLLEKARFLGEEMNKPVIVWTFEKHPTAYMGEHRYISTLEERLSLFEKMGINTAYLANFEDFKDVSADEFVEKWLVGQFGAKCVVCGFNFTYGKNRSGNAETLENKLKNLGVSSYVMPPVNVCGEVVSSSAIRKYISEGNAEKAALLLGRPYSFSLPVSHGNAYGRTIGVPTANVIFPAGRIVPKFGVYATICKIDGAEYPSVSNIGIRPTIDEEKKSVLCETHLLGESLNLYDREIEVSLISKLRDEQKFESFEHLVRQIRSDVESAKKFFIDKN